MTRILISGLLSESTCAVYLHTLDVRHVDLLVTSVANLQSKMARCVVVVVKVTVTVVLCIVLSVVIILLV